MKKDQSPKNESTEEIARQEKLKLYTEFSLSKLNDEQVQITMGHQHFYRILELFKELQELSGENLNEIQYFINSAIMAQITKEKAYLKPYAKALEFNNHAMVAIAQNGYFMGDLWWKMDELSKTF